MFPLTTNGTYYFGDFELNLSLRTLARYGQRVPLGAKAYEILLCLVANAGNVVSKAELMKCVWPDAHVEEGTLTQHIFSLRKALGDQANCIVTVPGHGYRFAEPTRHETPPIEDVRQPAFAESVVHEMRERTRIIFEEPVSQTQRKQFSKHSVLLIAVASVCLACVLFAGWHWWARQAPPRDHIGVVLADFTNASGDVTFDRALGRALQIDLSQSPFVDVISDHQDADTLRLMGQKPDTQLIPSVAREICERTNRQAYLTGDIVNFDGQYLVTLEATDCHTGKTLAAAKAEASSKVKVLDALDSVAESVRSKLGESAQSIQSFDIPLQRATTTSLDALKEYSIGMHLLTQANGWTEALTFFQRAIQIDPQFAQAYGAMANCYYNLSEPKLAAEAMKKAYELREHVDAPDRLTFEAHYLDTVLVDMPAAIKVYEEWETAYPRDWLPWVDGANLHQQLNQFDAAIVSGRHALALDHSVLCYIVLTRALKSAGKFAEAKALGQEAIQSGKDSGTLRSLLLEIAFDEQNATAFAQHSQAMANYKEDYRNYFLGKAASMNGKMSEAETLFRQEVAGEKQDGFVESADSVAIEQAAIERVAGWPETAARTLDGVAKSTRETPDYAVERANLGDTAFAERFLAAHQRDEHPSTDLQYLQLPQIRAALALAQHKPLDAIAALQGPAPYGVDPLSTLTLRSQAYLETKQFDQAAAQYKEILAHPGEGFGVEHPLAHLGLARAYAGEHNTVASRAEYETFLSLWKDADPDVPVLKTAKAELAQLR